MSENGKPKEVIPASRREQRALAFHYVYVAHSNGYELPLDDIITGFADDYHVRLGESDFPIRLAQGAIDNREKYDAIIEPLLENWSLRRVGTCTRLILHMALWEFEQEDAIAPVIINEAIELARAFAETDAYRFVNGILDQAQKQYPHSLRSEIPADEIAPE